MRKLETITFANALNAVTEMTVYSDKSIRSRTIGLAGATKLKLNRKLEGCSKELFNKHFKA